MQPQKQVFNATVLATLNMRCWSFLVAHQVQSAHPAYVRIDNSTDFEGKLQRAIDIVMSSLAAPLGSSRSYLTDGIGP